MKPEELSRFFEQKRKELDDYRRNKWPRMAGEIAQGHFQDNFRRGGHLTGGTLHPWPKTKRQMANTGKAANSHGPLLSERKVLMKSIRYTTGDARVRVFTDLPYAGIHNFGGTINIRPTVTPKMRRFAWAMYHKTKGKDKNEFNVWKALALTKKKKLDIQVTIPQRMFLNDAPEIHEAIEQAAVNQIAQMFNNL